MSGGSLNYLCWKLALFWELLQLLKIATIDEDIQLKASTMNLKKHIVLVMILLELIVN